MAKMIRTAALCMPCARPQFGTVWHADVTFDKRPPSISILR